MNGCVVLCPDARGHGETQSDKFFKALKNGPTKGWKVDKIELESALNEYYRQCGWNEETGNPTPETLHRLGLSWILTATIHKS